ncbi:MAG: hypothetical protein L6R38_003722 [Xanthoria sp. 2 TBL-2021]|nr:MAG: hypothetical protein L6R38_003722 [Xanthoria sp. 2 TBL-2021]
MMSPSLGYGLRPSVAVLSFLAALITLYLLPIAYQPRGHDLHHNVQISPQQSHQERDSKIGVPFGLNEYTHNFTAANRSSTLAKREIDYDRLVCKGRMLLNMILHSQPVDYYWSLEALKNGWTWRRNVLAAPPEELFGPLGKLGVPTDVHSVHSIYLKQDKPFMDSFGILNNAPTTGLYYNTFIPSGGTIIAESNFSPKFKAGFGSGRRYPPLWRWSDIIWLLWTHEAGLLGTPNLRYIFRANIITPETRELIEYIEVEKEDQLHLPWPGHTYDMSTEEGLALLATSHGQGIAYLIADHSQALGRKIPMARIFTELPGGVTDDEGSSSSSEGALSSDDAKGSEGTRFWEWGGQTYYYILWELRDSITG